MGIKASLGKYICTCFSFYERITVEHARPTSRSGGGGGGGGGGGSGGGSGMRRGGGFRFRDRSVTHMLMVFWSHGCNLMWDSWSVLNVCLDLEISSEKLINWEVMWIIINFKVRKDRQISILQTPKCLSTLIVIKLLALPFFCGNLARTICFTAPVSSVWR